MSDSDSEFTETRTFDSGPEPAPPTQEEEAQESDHEVPLPGGLAARMGEHLGADLSTVTLHHGERAAAAAQANGARAFAEGDHIFFADGELAPHTPEGEEVLAHELTHVAQAKKGGPRAASVEVSEAQAERAAHTVRQGGEKIQLTALSSDKPHFKKGAAKKVGPVEIRRDWLAAKFEAQATLNDIKGQPGAGANDRARAALLQLHKALFQPAGDVTKLFDAEKLTLAPTVNLLMMVAQQLNQVAPATTSAVLTQMSALADSQFGITRLATMFKDAEATAAERLPLADAALAAAAGELAAELADEHATAVGGGALGSLARARELLRGSLGAKDMEAREKRQAAVEKVTKPVLALMMRFDPKTDANLKELQVRVSDVRQAVMLQRMTDSTMGDIVKAQNEKGRGYTEEQAARFDATAAKVGIQLRLMQQERLIAVDAAEQEGNLAPPAPKTSFWEDLAWAALSLAGGAIAGKLVGMIATKAFGSNASLEVAKKAGEIFGKSDVVEKATKAMSSKAFLEKALGKLGEIGVEKGSAALKKAAHPEEAGKTPAKHEGGGSASDDPKIAFFTLQKRQLTAESAEAETHMVEVAQEARPHLADAPETTIANLEAAGSALLAGKETAHTTQLEQTRAELFTLLMSGQLGDTQANRDELKTKADKLKDGNVYEQMEAGELRGKYVHGLMQDQLYGKREGTDMSDAAMIEKVATAPGYVGAQNKHDVVGLLSMKIQLGKRPGDPVKVVEAWMKKVNEKLAGKVLGMKLNELHVPMRARGEVANGDAVSFARNETGAVWADTNGDGQDWCEARTGLKGEPALRAAGKSVLEGEIGQNSLTDLGIKELGS